MIQEVDIQPPNMAAARGPLLEALYRILFARLPAAIHRCSGKEPAPALLGALWNRIDGVTTAWHCLTWNSTSLISVLFNIRTGQSDVTQWRTHLPQTLSNLQFGEFQIKFDWSQFFLTTRTTSYSILRCPLSSLRGNLNWNFILQSVTFFWIGDKIRVPVKRVREKSVGTLVHSSLRTTVWQGVNIC